MESERFVVRRKERAQEARDNLRSVSRAHLIARRRQLGIGKRSGARWARCTHGLGSTRGWFLDREGVVEREGIPREAVRK
jgi:hypothetical protein